MGPQKRKGLAARNSVGVKPGSPLATLARRSLPGELRIRTSAGPAPLRAAARGQPSHVVSTWRGRRPANSRVHASPARGKGSSHRVLCPPQGKVSRPSYQLEGVGMSITQPRLEAGCALGTGRRVGGGRMSATRRAKRGRAGTETLGFPRSENFTSEELKLLYKYVA